MDKKQLSKEIQTNPELYMLLGTVNLSGRTKKQQEGIETKLLKAGSLWGKIDCLHKYIFTRKELNGVKRAKEVIDNHKQKCETLNCA